MKSLGIFLAILFTCLLASYLNAGQIYVWTDEDGIKHFSDNPPPENAKKIKVLKFKEKKEGKGEQSTDIYSPDEKRVLDIIKNLIEKEREKGAKISTKKKGEKAEYQFGGIEKLITVLKRIEENYYLIWISAFLVVVLIWIFILAKCFKCHAF